MFEPVYSTKIIKHSLEIYLFFPQIKLNRQLACDIYKYMKTRYKGIFISVLVLSSIFLVDFVTDRIVYHTGEYGEWYQCQSNFNHDNMMTYYLTEEIANIKCDAGSLVWDDPNYNLKNDCLVELETQLEKDKNQARIEKCGSIPILSLGKLTIANIRDINSEVRNIMFDFGLGMIIPFGGFLFSFLFICLCFFVGILIEKRKN